jgi:protein involved in polysaccharide export with SLBB domain
MKNRIEKMNIKVILVIAISSIPVLFAHAQGSPRGDLAADQVLVPRQSSEGLTSVVEPGRAASKSFASDAVLPQQNIDDLNRTLSHSRGPMRPESPSQFQLFVQEATGKLLPHFGAALFEAPQSYVPDAGLAAPSSYILGPGDEIRLQVWGSVDINLPLVIDRNGQVQIPKVGVVTLAGLTVAELVPTLKAQLAKVIANFNVNASLGRLRSIQVYVVGQARQPGTYAVSSLSTLVNALFASGGPSANGSMRAIELRRDGKLVTQIDLYDFITKGDKNRDVALLPGDVIFIPHAGPRVAVLGAFDQVAIFESKAQGESVSDVLSYGGGVPPIANVRKALLERVNPAVKSAREVLDLALDANGLTQKLQGGDILTLLPVSPAFANAVTLQGVVAEPVRHRWFAGMRVLDLIPNTEALVTPDYFKRKNLLTQGDQSTLGAKSAGAAEEAGAKITERFRRMADQINWDYAVVERLNPDRLTTELLPFNLGRAVLQRDASQNLVLLPGDVVTILGRNELALPQERQTRLVRVEGEIAAPGIYQALPGESMGQLLRRIGGLTPQAYVYGTEFSRESIRKRQQANLEALIRRLEAQAQSNAQNVSANAASSSKADSATQAQFVVAQQQAQLKSQIERLRALKSTGRMSLELDTRAQALADLPQIALEDGDQINVPSVPSYVAAFGAVNNENVFLYKPGKTVADIVKSAGLTDEAEPDQLFLVRADGSVVSRADHSSLFGRAFSSTAVMPGDTLVVPAKWDRETGYNATVRGLKDWTQILSNLGLGLAAIKTLKN